MNHSAPSTKIELRDLAMAYGQHIVMRDITVRIRQSDVFVIMGGSGSGKSTLLKAMIGLKKPAQGDVFYDGRSFWQAEESEQQTILRRFGVLFQNGALWSSMTVAENIALPLAEHTDLPAQEINELVRLKLALVGLKGCEDYMPAELSGGMRKRAGLARALALDPEILFFDEPSAGLDPINARRLDDLILELRDSLGATIVVVTHDLQSIFAIADDSVFLDGVSHTMRARGTPRELLACAKDSYLREFLTRGESSVATAAQARAGAIPCAAKRL
jgi:phospholipid/cholesterol/gamma-HCH transport system ATP-binding protein